MGSTQPEDDEQGKLSFQPALARHQNDSSQVGWLALTDIETGEQEVLGASSPHFVWVVSTSEAQPLAPIADVRQDHTRHQRHYAQLLSDITDRWIRPEDVKQGYVLVAADGTRHVVEQPRLEQRLAELSDGTQAKPTLLAEPGGVYSPDLREGYVLRAADGRLLRMNGVRVEQGRRAVYDLTVSETTTYFIGNGIAWAHNNSQSPSPRSTSASPSASSGTSPTPNRTPPGGVNPWHHGPLTEGRALRLGEQWIGPGYREIAPGVYRSADGLRQFRITRAIWLVHMAGEVLMSILRRLTPAPANRHKTTTFR